MVLRGKAHWKDCAEYYERYTPTATEVFTKEDNIKHDQYTKAFGQIGQVLSTEGRLMTVVEQVVIFEQNILRTLKGLSPACEFYAKLLHGMYHFLEQLRGLKTATEQATQTFATSQAEELFHPQLEALLVTWLFVCLFANLVYQAEGSFWCLFEARCKGFLAWGLAERSQ